MGGDRRTELMEGFVAKTGTNIDEEIKGIKLSSDYLMDSGDGVGVRSSNRSQESTLSSIYIVLKEILLQLQSMG